MAYDPTKVTLGADSRIAPTATDRDPWQEPLARYRTVPSSKVVQAAEVIRGVAGSWAGFYLTDPGILDPNRAVEANVPSPQQVKVNRLGQPGLSEINFQPYAHNTNRFGHKGGSLIGHPISFAVVGPTAKNINTTWQWAVTDKSAVPGTGDYLTLDNAGADTLTTLYSVADLTRFDGGLYVVISLAGGRGLLTNDAGADVAGGIGDGGLTATAGGQVGCTPLTATSKFEIFRVISVAGVGNTRIELDPTKRLATYFTVPVALPTIRAITLIEPIATRLVAIPDSGTTKRLEQVFTVVPPWRALNDDQQYPYKTWTNAAFAEDGTGFTTDGNNVPSQYRYRNPSYLPISRPTADMEGRLFGEVGDGVLTDTGPGTMTVFVEGGTTPAVGQILHIYGARVRGAGQLDISAVPFQAEVSSVLGWFEVVTVEGVMITVRRVDEINPSTGRSLYGSNAVFALEQTGIVAGDGIDLDVTVHDPVHALWRSTYFDADRLASTRLTTLIDPDWVERSAKEIVRGTTAARADRAVFDTTGTGAAGTNANPGSLLDLGFRMVLFPAKVKKVEATGGLTEDILAPDWGNPISSNELLLDSTATDEKQYVEVDYANGLVRFSHPIKTGSPLYPPVAVFAAADNPRGEMVVFACCVPYSMEEGQAGGGVRVVGGHLRGDAVDCGAVVPTHEYDRPDVYGARAIFPLAAQTVTANHDPANILVLEGLFKNQLPQSGFLELLWGTQSDGDPLFEGLNYRGSIFGYTGASEGGGQTTLAYAYGGGEDAATATVDADHPAAAILRRDVVLPGALNGVAGADYQHDTTFGAAKRAKTLFFDDAEVAAGGDGSVIVRPKSSLAQSAQGVLDAVFSTWILSGGVLDGAPAVHNAGPATYTVPYTAMTLLTRGIRRQAQAGFVDVPDNSSVYVYCDSTDCYEVKTAVSLPLTAPDDILLGRTNSTFPGAVAVYDLRNPLADVDRRVDIYVGQSGWAAFTPHFDNLAAAVAYASEIMTPTAGVGNLVKVRIVVVGQTEEALTDLPILIGTDGLIIEGAPWVEGTNEPEVCWGHNGADDVALIDFNGHSNVTIRNVAFRCRSTDAVNITALRVLFTNKVATTLSDITIDGCRLFGVTATTRRAQGFFYAATGAFDRLRIVNNVAANLLDLGIGLVTPATLNNSVIEGNDFKQDATVGGMPAAEQSGIYLVIAPDNFNNRIIGNHINLFTTGIKANQLDWSFLANNYVQSTVERGMDITGTNLTIRENELSDIYTAAVIAPAYRRGLLVEGASGNSHIVGNRVLMHDGVVVGDFGIETTSVGARVDANTCPSLQITAAATDVEVSGTICTRLTVLGANPVVRANSVVTLEVGFDAIAKAFTGAPINGTVLGNFVSGIACLGIATYAEGNNFNQPAAPSGGLYVASGCHIVNNEIAHLKEYADLEGPVPPGGYPFGRSDGVVLVGNRIAHVGENHAGPVAEDYIFEGIELVVGNNQFNTSEVIFSSANDSVIEGNSFANNLTLGVSGAPIVNTVVKGNKFVLDDAPGAVLAVYGNKVAIAENITYHGIRTGSITVTGMEDTISGNITGDLLLDGINTTCTVQGNKVYGDLVIGTGVVLTGGNHTVTGNSVLEAGKFLKIRVVNCVATGNQATDIEVKTSAVGCVINGNWTGTIVDEAAGGEPATIVVIGNRATDVFGVGMPNVSDKGHNAHV